MRKVFALSLPLMTALFVATARPAVAETEITTCGQVLPGGAVFLSGDLDCPYGATDYAIRFESSGVVDLRGFTIRNASTAIACDGNCNVKNGSLIDNLTGVAGARVKLANVTIGVEQHGMNFGVIGEKGANLENVTISGAYDAGVVGNYSSVKLDTVTITGGRDAVRTQGNLTAVNTTVSGVTRGGLTGKAVRLIRSSVTGSGTDPDCNKLVGVHLFLCADVLSWKKPTVRRSTCDTSMVIGTVLRADPDDWNVCTLD